MTTIFKIISDSNFHLVYQKYAQRMAFYKLEKAIGLQIYKKKIFLNERKEETLKFTNLSECQMITLCNV